MIRRPPRSTQSRSSAASDVYKRQLMGSTYQHVIPETPQPWSDYFYSGSWWKAAPKRYWGAADPPVETGVCEPHDVHKIGYRTLIPTRYMTAVGEDYTVRMEGCFGCPLRCHIASHVPSAEKWGTSPDVVNTCTGMFLANFIPAANYTKNLSEACLLYTSDAADDLLCVDLGGRRIIKKK